LIRKFTIVCVLFCQCLNFYGQFLDDFSDNDLNTNPVWEGDLQDFIVNDDQKLQLNAVDEGSSQLFTQLTFADSIQWEFEAELDFSPSNNNRLRVYLAINHADVTQASGYFMEIGENGANDALNFYKLLDGSPELLASGELAALATEPAYVKVLLTYFPPSGEWVISTSYKKNSAVSEEIILSDDSYDFSGNQLFMLECNYTSSRSDKFFFDNIGIKKYEEDRTGPVITDILVIDKRNIAILANERLDPISANEKDNFSVSNFPGSIENIIVNADATEVILRLSEDLSPGTSYTVSVSNLFDVNGNVGENASFDVFVQDEAIAGDLIVNEILFNPETGGSDFVEILNVSNKSIFLGNLALLNADKNEFKPITIDAAINPGQYLCLTEDVAYLRQRYETPDTARFGQVDIPSFNNDEGNVSIVNTISSEIIDSYDYSEDTHLKLLEDLNGVSLERVSPVEDNWVSASSRTLFASPGYQNSTFLNPNFDGEEVMSFENKTFSPNQDGSEDQLIIKYKLPSDGYLVDIMIFDQYGRLVRMLVNNQAFTQEGFVIWDGLNEGGETLSIGIYFVVMEAFNQLGDVIKTKKPAILAEFLK